MRAIMVRHKLVKAAVLAASAVLVAACGVSPSVDTSASPTASPSGPLPGFAVGTLLVSNGTTTVNVGGTEVTFPTKVSDAAWSHDGSRIAFIDADGNIATAHPDGTGLVTLTRGKAGVIRSEPTWLSGSVVFTELASGRTRLRMVPSAGDAAHESAAFFAGEETLAVSAADVVPAGVGREVAYQVQQPTGPEIWVQDFNAREPLEAKVADGTQPALAPDGKMVAFVDRTGQISIVDARSATNPVRISAGVKSATRLTWSPNGNEVVFQTPTGIEAVAAAGTGGKASHQVFATTGVATYLAKPRDTVSRLTAADPVALSVVASRGMWPTRSVYQPSESGIEAREAVLVSTTNLPTALAGTLAQPWGPVLFTPAGSLDPRTRAELKRVFGNVESTDEYGPMVTIIGDTQAVSTSVENAVKALGYRTERIAGHDQYDIMAAFAAKRLPSYIEEVYVIDGEDLSTLATAGAAYGQGRPNVVLLARNSTLGAGAKTLLDQVDKSVTVYAVGTSAQAGVAASWRGNVVAVDATASAILDLFGTFSSSLIVAGRSAMDDLVVAAGMRGFHRGAQVVAVDAGAGLSNDLRTWLDKSSAQIDETFIVDGAEAIGASLQDTIGRLACGPLGHSKRTNPTF